MKISGSTHVDLSLENNDYEIEIDSNSNNLIDLGLSRKMSNKTNTNIANIVSNLGPIKLKLSLNTEKNYIPDNFEDINLSMVASYDVDKHINMGIKYETDGNQNHYEILSGVIDSKVKYDDFSLNLSTENILYGYKKDSYSLTTLHGNRIHPSIGIADDSLKIGLLHNQREEIDDYGNKNENSSNKISLGFDLKF